MRKCLIAASILLVGLASCKTNENNYREAYERTMAGRNAEADDNPDATPINPMRQMRMGALTVGDRTVQVASQFVTVTPDGGGIPEYIKRYCVVAGQFKQVFNARSMRDRLVEQGYPGAFVVQNREPYYYVIAGSTSDAQEAVALIDRLSADENLKLRSPLPYVLQPSQIR